MIIRTIKVVGLVVVVNGSWCISRVFWIEIRLCVGNEVLRMDRVTCGYEGGSMS